MSENTSIEWCDHSWSPWRGCTKVSAGCANCYAETLSKRNPAVLGEWGKGKPRVLAKNWGDPVKWNRRQSQAKLLWTENEDIYGEAGFINPSKKPAHATVFPSLCDWLDDEVPIEWLAQLLTLIHDTPHLTWLLLTKRPENWHDRLFAAIKHNEDERGDLDVHRWMVDWISPGNDSPRNVWIGTSVEDQPNADRRIPELLKISAVGRFLSLEPLLGPVRVWSECRIPPDENGPWRVGYMPGSDDGKTGLMVTPAEAMKGINWLIIGGESGHGARPCNVEWIRSLVAQGKAAGVPTFVKQLGANVPCANCGKASDCVGAYECQTEENPACSECCGHGCEDGHCVPLAHPKGGDPSEWPKDMRVREFPEGLR